MKKTLISLIGIFLLSVSAAFAESQLGKPYSEVKNKIVISEFKTFPSVTSDDLFLKAVLWVIENRQIPEEGEDENNTTFAVDYDKKMFSVELTLGKPDGNRYHCVFTGKIADNIITIQTSEIVMEAPIAVIKISKKLPFEKLQIEKKPKHKEYADEFAELYKAMSNKLFEYIKTSASPVIKHWEEIKAKDVVKGMNKQECLLAFGKPLSINKDGNKEEWMYDSYTYLFFENDIVTSLIK
ncbi:hypothetical protein [uncultured Bacteroides sp.]|uniref:hypothetical protein n=1 Tax=uncultured Bacteroides sp. TaxID=162156 RepID=UPI00260AFDEF|nr:hypothetical protein [uncultured Bacteroides sp.]